VLERSTVDVLLRSAPQPRTDTDSYVAGAKGLWRIGRSSTRPVL